MQKIKNFLKLPELEDFYDYEKPIHFVIVAVYLLIMISMILLSSNPERLAPVIIPLIFVVTAFLYRRVLIHDIKIFGKNIGRYVVEVVLGFLMVNFLMVQGNRIPHWLGAGNAPNQLAVQDMFWQAPILGAFAIAIAAPIAEELVFRRAIKGMTNSKILYYALSAVLFGVAHIVVDFSFPTSFVFLAGYALVGLGFAYLYDSSKNIWVPIFVHLINNTLGVIMIIVSGQ